MTAPESDGVQPPGPIRRLLDAPKAAHAQQDGVERRPAGHLPLHRGRKPLAGRQPPGGRNIDSRIRQEADAVVQFPQQNQQPAGDAEGQQQPSEPVRRPPPRPPRRPLNRLSRLTLIPSVKLYPARHRATADYS